MRESVERSVPSTFATASLQLRSMSLQAETGAQGETSFVLRLPRTA